MGSEVRILSLRPYLSITYLVHGDTIGQFPGSFVAGAQGRGAWATCLTRPHSLAPNADLKVSALLIASVTECDCLVERGESSMKLAFLPHLKRKVSVVIRNGHWFAVAFRCHAVPSTIRVKPPRFIASLPVCKI